MKKYIPLSLAVSFLAVLGLIQGCSQESSVEVSDYKVSEEGAQIVAQVNQVNEQGNIIHKGQITKAELDYNLAFYSSNPTTNTDDGRMTVLNEMIEDQIMYNKAVESGFDQHPEFLINQRKLLAYEYRKYLKQKVGENTKVTDVDLDLFYQQNLERYTKPAMFRMAIYERRSDLNRKYELSLEQVAQSVQYLKPEEGFGKYAKTSTHLKTANRNGRLSWMSATSTMAGIPQQVISEASKLDVGKVSSPIKVKNKTYLVRLIGKKQETVTPLNDIKADLRRQLLEERKKEQLAIFIKQAKKSMKIDILENNVEKATAEPHSFGPPGFPAN